MFEYQKMTEQFLQFIWKNKLFEQKTYAAHTGELVQIIHPGEQNFNAGPDFQCAKIRIADNLWAGNCEVHIKSSDWLKHHHQQDGAYDNVVLHVVLKNDTPVVVHSGRQIPTIEIEFDPQLEENYNQLLSADKWVACAPAPALIEHFYLSQWMTSLSIERLQQRHDDIVNHLKQSKFHWENTFYYFLAKGFGFKVNATPFELLAKSLPLEILAKHKNNLKQLEALLFGQSGLLEIQTNDDYSLELYKEYEFLKKKYQLSSIDSHLWKFLRLRPINFPTIRIAQFAALIHKSSALFSKVIEAKTIEELHSLLFSEPSEYWKTHYKFGNPSKALVKHMAEASLELLIVNTIIPFIFVYGKQKKLPDYSEKAINLLEELKPEKNSIIGKWVEMGIEPRNMMESQALLQLKKEYCDSKNCLNCTIGKSFIANKI